MKIVNFIRRAGIVSVMAGVASGSFAQVSSDGGKATVDFSSHVAGQKGRYVVMRADSRFGEYKQVGKTSKPVFVDKHPGKTWTSCYYRILDEKGDTVALMSRDIDLFGENVYVFSPSDDMTAVGREINAVHAAMFRQEMSPERYAILFRPGDYTEAGLLKIPFYVHMAGLGKTPYEVKVDNIHTPPHLRNDNGTCTFWRSLENLSVVGPESYDHEEMFNWAVSQAAPIRRVYSQRTVRYQWKYGWVSGGFTADCKFDAPAGSDGQQQWYTRNSYLGKGRGRFAEGAYNFVFNGVELGDGADKESYICDDWTKGSNVTFIEETPVVREKPFLFVGDDGRYKVFRPALKKNSKGVSYTRDDMGKGETLDLLDSFFIARPGVTAAEINANLKAGKNILLTPGMYEISEPIRVSRPNAIVMGLGWSTIVPGPECRDAAMVIDDVDGVQVASILFDAHNSSTNLLRVGDGVSGRSHKDNPVVLNDLFFRIGGFMPHKVHVDCAVEINSDDAVGDHFWIWRADHGVRGSVGWDVNTADHGLVVNGRNATIYGLFNEHFQKYQTLWNGEGGRVYFYQCETPYDAPSQEVFMSENGTRPGYAAYKVADNVRSHQAYGIGIYDVLHHDICFKNSIEVPDNKGIEMFHLVNTSFIPGDKKGFNSVINGIEPSTYTHAKQYVARVPEFIGKN